MSFDVSKCFEIENGIAIEDLNGNTVILSAGSGSPTGVDAPIGTRYFQNNGTMWIKHNTGTNDWRVYPFSYNHSEPTEPGTLLLWNPITAAWEPSTKLRYHSIAPIPDSTNISTNGSLYLTNESHSLQFFTGTGAGYKVYLPDATTVTTGLKIELANTTSYPIDIYTKGGLLQFTLSQNATATVTLQLNADQNGVWIATQTMIATIASGLISYKVISSTPFSTNSNADVLISEFAVTPEAGTYAIWFSADSVITANNALAYYTVYKGGASIIDSKRTIQGSSSNFKSQMGTLTISQFNGGQQADTRIAITSNYLTVNQRTLLLIRLGT
jgi:hypothetical protein